MTPKQEAFCLSYIEAGNASEAYRRAYDAERMSDQVIHNKASDLLKRDDVRVRLKELHAGLRERHNVTIDSLTKELEADREIARANNQASAAVSATMSIARIHGLADGDKMIKFDIPTIEDAADAMAATATIIQGVVQGDLAPEDAKAVTTLVETYRRAVETVDLEERVSALE